MTRKYLDKMLSLGYTEAEAEQHWTQAMSCADTEDPIYKVIAEKHPNDNDAAREEYAFSRIEGLPLKDPAKVSINSDPLINDTNS